VFMLNFFIFGCELGLVCSLRDNDILFFVADASFWALVATSCGSSLI
jgi:hypothetical protein